MKVSFALSAVFLLSAFEVGAAQATPWLTDEQGREIAGAAIHGAYPEPCYSTYRLEHLESWVLSVRKKQILGNHLNNSVYFYRVASDVCDYVVENDGKYVRTSQVTLDCCDYGIVAVDRGTSKSYWFAPREKAPDIFKDFVRDEQLQPDLPQPGLFTALYLNLVWGEDRDAEISSLGQLRNLVQRNFQSAYSPYERDNNWEHKFAAWWRRFRSRLPHLKLETAYEPASAGTIVRGYRFDGFELTIPRSDPPPKGTPKLIQWALLVKADGTIEEQPSKVIYSSR
jgi:hypothetical protein